MKKWLYWILVAALLAVFLFSAGKLLLIRHRYRASEQTHTEAVSRFTRPAESVSVGASGEEPSPVEAIPEKEADPRDIPPIEVDFDELVEVNPDVVGWICCPDTGISYPVVWGRDNEYYLSHDYLGAKDPSGTIFINGHNRRDLSDSNILVYGHHMQDQSMFGTLRKWLQQDWFDEHPVMWLLTPEQNYRIELFAGYLTKADAAPFTIFEAPGEDFDRYLRNARDKSQVSSDVELDGGAQYVMLSTCAYDYELARTVLHGRLVPVGSPD